MRKDIKINKIFVDKLGKKEALMIIGSTGAGKTTFIRSLIDPKLKFLFADIIKNKDKDEKKKEKLVLNSGDGKQLINNKRIVKFNITDYNGFDNKVGVCIKRKNGSKFRESLNVLFIESFCSTVLKFRNGEADSEEVSIYFRDRFSREVKGSVFYDMLSNDIDNFINKAIFKFDSVDMMCLYNKAKNKLSKNDRNNEEFVKCAIKEEIFLNKVLTVDNINLFEDKDNVLDKNSSEEKGLNFNVDRWLKVFDKRIKKSMEEALGNCEISKDGYYMKSFIKEDLKDDELILWKKIMTGEDSFKFIDELVINITMNKNVVRIIREQGNTNLINRHGNTTLSIFDYNYNFNDDIENEYKLLEEFIYSRRVGGIIGVRDGGGLCKSGDAILREVIKRLNKAMLLFIVHNKIDIYINQFRKSEVEDILEINSSNLSIYSTLSDLECSEVIESLNRASKTLYEKLDENQSMKKKKLEIYISYTFAIHSSNLIEKQLIDEYAPINFVNTLIKGIAKPKVKALDVEVKGSDDELSFDLDKVDIIINFALTTKESKKCIAAMKQNIAEHIGLEIDKDTFREIEYKIGIGETATYSSDRGSALGGVNFQVPSNFKNMITETLVKEIITKAIDFKSITATNEVKTVMINEVLKLKGQIAREIVQNILCDVLEEVILENGLERESIIFDSYLRRLYANLITLEKEKTKEAEESFRGKLNNVIANSILGHIRLIFKEEGKVIEV